MGKRLFKSTAVVGGMTLLSRLLGFVRDMLIARFFGVDIATDAFFVAFKIPNFLRRLFTEGAFAHALVPPLVSRKANPANLQDFISQTASLLAAWSLLLLLILMLFAPVLIMVLAPGFMWQGSQYDLAVMAVRLMLPFGFCTVLVSFAGAVLNAHDKYAIPAFTPVLLNVCMISATLWLAPLMDIPIMALAWGVCAAGFIQLCFQLPGLAKLGLLPRLTVNFQDSEVKVAVKKLWPAIFSSSVTQINVLFDTMIASFLVSGSVSWLYYSDRLVEFPLSILGLGLSTVILPQLTNHHTAENSWAFSATLDWGLRWVILAGMPAMIGLIVLAQPILSTLFQYDEFTVDDVHKAAFSLRAYAIGLLGFLCVKVLMPAFSSRRDLRTPVRYGLYAMIASLFLNILAIPLAHAGLALATSLGALLNALLLLAKLFREKVYQPLPGWFWFSVRIILASVVMTAILVQSVDNSGWSQWQVGQRVTHLVLWISAGIAAYALTLLLTGLRLRHLLVASDRITGI